MYTESYMRHLPVPRHTPTVDRMSPEPWLQAFRDSAVDVRLGLAATHRIISRMVTRPRTAANTYTTNYLFYSPDADLRVQTTDGVSAAATGSVLWFPPGVPYSLYLHEEPTDQTLYRLRFTVVRRGRHLSPWQHHLCVPGCDWFPELAGRVMRELSMPDQYAGETHRALVTDLSVSLLRTMEDVRSRTGALPPGLLRRLHAYVQGRMSSRPSPADLAAVAGLSPAYFTKVFVKATGMAPRRWLVEQRVRHGACLLMDTPARVSEIAGWLGYDEPRLFTRQFTDVFGVGPRAYRRREPPSS